MKVKGGINRNPSLAKPVCFVCTFRSSSLFLAFALLLLFASGRARMIDGGLPKLSKLGFDVEEGAVALVQIALRRQRALVVLA